MPVPEAAFEMGLHLVSEAEMYRRLREQTEACPKMSFEKMQVGKSYLDKSSISRQRIFKVLKMTPSGKQAEVINYSEDRALKVYAGGFRSGLLELSDMVLSFAKVTHEQVIEEAVLRKLSVPPQVRCEHPQFFVEIPERFARWRDSAVARVRSSLKPCWSREPVTVNTVNAWIFEAHKSIQNMACERTRRVALNPAIAADYDHYMRGYRDDIDFYRWLWPLVDVGGIFHVSK